MGILDTIGGWLDFGSATLGSDSDIYGGAGNDYLYGTDNGEYISAGDGNDWIRAFGGADLIYAGNGADLIEGGSGNDLIDGGAGIDTASYFNSTHGVIANLEFGTAKTLGAGPEDTDTLVSIENLTGSFYADYLQGTDYANVLDGVAGADVLNGWGGNDTLIGGFGNDFIVGGDGNDKVSGGFDNDSLYGNAGTDTLDYFYAYEGMYVSLAEGVSHVRNPYSTTIDNDDFSGFENVTGSQFDDVIEGNGVKNVINGGLGNDTVSYRHSAGPVGVALDAGFGTLGDAWQDTYYGIENIDGSDNAMGDVLSGNALANRIDGNGGNDAIYGRGGNDTLIGGSGDDYLDGGDGNDLLNGGGGADRLDGGAGIDTADFTPLSGGVSPAGTPGVTVDLTAGTASGFGNDGSTLVNIENVIGTQFDDQLSGDANGNALLGGYGADLLIGRNGDDVLTGGGQNDSLSGGAGNDVLNGGTGADVLLGGAGNDVFVFASLADSGLAVADRDIIRDFQAGDMIDLSGIDANANVAGDQAFNYPAFPTFTGAAGELRSYVAGTSTFVEGDVNGDGIADFQIRLVGVVAIQGGDFVL